ncbi:DNA-processing protein DprA [Spirochaeta cellobiosiphila]|uniref:DNA-processing protein DprA n=1 Tax=Spirochaeta cellobiosiphila TaxID=504483 RepID=UPI0004133C41|nr:DNA-processing protein DprA [Spirochaeta cellobiosiphila]
MDNFLIALSYLEFLSFEERCLIFDTFDWDSFKKIELSDLQQLIGRNIKTKAKLGSELIEEVQRIESIISDQEIGILNYWKKEYPPLLREIVNPPFNIFYKGTMSENTVNSLAIVGTRKPSELAKRRVYEWSEYLSRNGINIVSGLALGIDSAAHYGSVNTKAPTTAVLANGVDYVYPKVNKILVQKILENKGCLISEYVPSTEPRPFRFPARNRIISGISRGTLLCEAPIKSGALITVDYALEQNRDVFVDKRSSLNINGEGCLRLISQGAQSILEPEEILMNWNLEIHNDIALNTKENN